MLVIDGKRYKRWLPQSERAFEEIVKEHAQDIFGDKSIYFDLKHKLHGSSIATIPDAYVITLDPDKLYIIEVELSTHPVWEHIMPQLGKFLATVRRPATRDRLRDELWREIQANNNFKEMLGQKGEAFKFLTDLVRKPLEVVVIIDSFVPELEDVEVALGANVTICEFTTFCREGMGLSDHAHYFEPLTPLKDGYPVLWQSLLDGVKSYGLPVKHRTNKRVYQPISTGRGGIHFEWIAYHNALGVELHFEQSDSEKNKKILKVFELKKSEIENKLGEPLVFDYSFHKRWTRLFVRKAYTENEVRPLIGEELKRWGIETMVKLYKACKPILDRLDKKSSGK